MERKGILTPDQEKLLDELIKFNKPLYEKVDGTAIKLIDNQGIERILDRLEIKYPGVTKEIENINDILFEGLKQIVSSN